MRNRNTTKMYTAVLQRLFTVLCCFTVLVASDCGGPGDSDGESISNAPLIDMSEPVDAVLNLNCALVGINDETCVLDDPENPFIDTAIVQFDENDPESEAFNKFELANDIPAGPSGAKSRFYYWATALAQRPDGENQYYTALALHELYTVQIQQTGFGDPIVQNQALEAYRSLLDNFFGSLTRFACFYRDGVFRGCPPAVVDPDLDEPAEFGIPLAELTACNLVFKEATATTNFGQPIEPYPDGYERLVLGEELGCFDDGCRVLATLDLLSEWNYAYIQPPGGTLCLEGVVIDGGG